MNHHPQLTKDSPFPQSIRTRPLSAAVRPRRRWARMSRTALATMCTAPRPTDQKAQIPHAPPERQIINSSPLICCRLHQPSRALPHTLIVQETHPHISTYPHAPDMATRVTIANNAQQTHKTPLLIPACASADPSAPDSARALVFRAARDKLHVKKPARVFVKQTGRELVSEEDWRTGVGRDAVLLVSAGEECVGGVRKGVGGRGTFEHICASCPFGEILALSRATRAHRLHTH